MKVIGSYMIFIVIGTLSTILRCEAGTEKTDAL